jgi:hypothetical protein
MEDIQRRRTHCPLGLDGVLQGHAGCSGHRNSSVGVPDSAASGSSAGGRAVAGHVVCFSRSCLVAEPSDPSDTCGADTETARLSQTVRAKNMALL